MPLVPDMVTSPLPVAVRVIFPLAKFVDNCHVARIVGNPKSTNILIASNINNISSGQHSGNRFANEVEYTSLCVKEIFAYTANASGEYLCASSLNIGSGTGSHIYLWQPSGSKFLRNPVRHIAQPSGTYAANGRYSGIWSTLYRI